jgi:hypothetical protein
LVSWDTFVGPVLVAVHFTVAPEWQAGFLEAMH